MKIKTIQNTYIEAEIVLADRRLKSGEQVQLRCVLDSKLGPVYLTEKLKVEEAKSTNDTYCSWNYVLQDKYILPGTYNFEIVIVQGSGLVIPISSKAENTLIIVPAERGECFLKSPEKKQFIPNEGDIGTLRVNNPAYVDQMIAVAKSYYIKDAQYFKDNGRHYFNYHQGHTCMDNSFGYQTTKPCIWPDNGKNLSDRRLYSKPIAKNNFFDCSSYINLVLRGIPFDKSPYVLEAIKREYWDKTRLVANSGVYPWAMNPFDWYMHKSELNPFWDDAEYISTTYESTCRKQEDGKTPEVVTVHTTDAQKKYDYYKTMIPRTSANLGKLLAVHGGNVDFKKDYSNVEPGDIILYSSTNPDANPHDDGWKYITHIAICGSKEPVTENDTDYGRFKRYPYKHRLYDSTYKKGLMSEIKDEKGNIVDYDIPTFIQYIPISDENGKIIDVISERYLESDNTEVVAIVRPDLTGTQWSQKVKKNPTLTDAQKRQMQDLIIQYSSVKQTLFYYTGAARRESYVSPNCITKTGYSTETQLGCVYQFQDDNLDKKIYTDNGKAVPDKTDRYYYKYMLNCGVYCQMIWMGRPISDFITEGEGKSLIGTDSNDLLYYVKKQLVAPMHHALQAPPEKLTKKINSVFGTGEGETPWGYYFNFELSKRMYKATNGSGDYYTYNSFFNYKNNPIVIPVTEPADLRYTFNHRYGKITAHPLTNQVIVDRRVEIILTEPIAANTDIVIGTFDKYIPDHQTAMAVFHASKTFSGRISIDGKIIVKCAEALSAGSCYLSVNASYTSPTVIEEGEQLPLGFDGAANMAQELYVMGCEVPYSEIDIGDLVFFRAADISNDFRNKSTADDDDAMINRLFRNISHVGIVYSFDDKGYPIISDCTNAYSYPTVIGRTSLESTETFSKVKAAYERNNVVMVARHPAAFGLGGNVPEEFEPYRGILV